MFRRTNTSYPQIRTRTCAFVRTRWSEMFVFRKIWRASFSWNTRFEIFLFALLTTYYFNCLHSFRTANKLKSHEDVCNDHDYCYVEAHTNILKFNHEQKSVKIPFDIYDYIESLLEKISTCDKNPQESYTIKTNKHIACGYSIFPHCLFNTNRNKHDLYRGADPIKMLCTNLSKHGPEIINC